MAGIGLKKQITEYVIEYKENHYRLAYSYVRNVDDALDIVQESIYKAFSSIDSLKNPSHIKTWFYRIIVNNSLDFLRKRKKVLVTDEEDWLECGENTADHDRNIDLHRALESLTDHYRTIVILKFFEDMTLNEIAEVLDMNVNTVKTRLYQSLKKLRIKLEDER